MKNFALFAIAAMLASPSEASAQRLGSGEALERADSNEDGRISRAEFDRFSAERFERMDRNYDGYFSQSDLPRRLVRERTRERVGRLIEAMDENGDGRITRAEWLEGLALIFEAGDSNSDDYLDRLEVDVARQRMQDFRPR